MKKALISGVTGQDGSFLAELLLAKGYEVHGIVRRASTFNTGRLDGIYADPHESGIRLSLHYGDVTDASCLRHILEKVQYACLRPTATTCVSLVARCVFTRPVPRRCSARQIRRKTRPRRFIPAARTRSARWRRIGTASIFAKRTTYSSVTASCLTMSLSGAVKPSSPVRLRAR